MKKSVPSPEEESCSELIQPNTNSLNGENSLNLFSVLKIKKMGA